MHVENSPIGGITGRVRPACHVDGPVGADLRAVLFDASICARVASWPVLPSLGNILSSTCPTSRPLLQPSLLTLTAIVDLPVHTSCTRRPLQLKTPLTPDGSIDTHLQQATNTILQR
jgi:hypothetical protein